MVVFVLVSDGYSPSDTYSSSDTYSPSDIILINVKSKYEAKLILFKIIGRSYDRYSYAMNISNILEKYYNIKKSYIKSMMKLISDDDVLNNTWDHLYRDILEHYETWIFNGNRDISYRMKSDLKFLKKELYSNKKSFSYKIKNHDVKFVNECLKNKYLNVDTYDNVFLITHRHELSEIITYKCEITIVAIKRILKKVKNTPYWYILRMF